MNATVSPPPSISNGETTKAKWADDVLSLDFTRRPVTEIISPTTLNQGEEMPVLLDYTKWETWYDGFVAETASLPWSERTVSTALSEFVKASASGDERRPDIAHALKRAYEKYASEVESNGFDKIGKGEFVELFIKELKVIPSKLYAKFLKKDELEARARNFRLVANAHPGNSEIRKLRDLADTLALGRSKFSYETSEKLPENPSVKLRLAIDELALKLEKSVRKPKETPSILTTPVSELVSRALSGFGIGKKEKHQ